MSDHIAHVEWQLGDGSFGPDYHRTHIWRFDGGVEVPASSAAHLHGDPSQVDPEEAFVASISSCHMLWFLFLAAEDGWVVESYVDDAVGHLERIGRGVSAVTKVELRPAVSWRGPEPDGDALADLHDRSHHRCFIANSVRSEITVSPR